jgi:hypothetical protein
MREHKHYELERALCEIIKVLWDADHFINLATRLTILANEMGPQRPHIIRPPAQSRCMS